MYFVIQLSGIATPLALDKRHSFSISICDKSVWLRLLPYALPIIVPSGSPAVLHTLI